jgi:hypothetical protein
MISMEMSASPWVLDTSGERFRLQLMNTARRSEKSVVAVRQSSSCLSVSCIAR